MATTIGGSVGRAATNRPADVSLVQKLLNEVAFRAPYADASTSGRCDQQTIFLIEQFQMQIMGAAIPTGTVEPGSASWHGLNGQSGGKQRDRQLDEILAALNMELAVFAQRFIQDGAVRAAYVSNAQEFVRDLLRDVDAGRLAPIEAASKARLMRNALLEAARLSSSDIGKAVAVAEKASGLSMEALLAKYSKKLFGKAFEALSTSEQDIVFIEIARAAGRPNVKFTGVASNLGKVGKGLIVLSIAIAVYDIAESDRPGRETVKQATGAGVGFLGSLAGGAVAGLACGPGAPLCVGVGVFVGGLVFVLGANFAFDGIWE